MIQTGRAAADGKRTVINWNQVFLFSEIASAGSIKAAAEKLDLSPSTLSEHLSQLERDLNVRLFDRQVRKLTLTREGRTLFQSAKQMFDAGRRFVDFLSPLSVGGYPVAIGIVPGSSYEAAHRVVRAYLGRHHEASASVHRYLHDGMEQALIEATLDFGFTDRRTERPDVVQMAVTTSESSFFVSSAVPTRDLQGHLAELPLVICRSERRTPTAIEEVLESMELTPKAVIVSEYPSLVESLCREGKGIAVLGREHFEADPGVRLVRLPAQFPVLTEKLYAAWSRAATNSEAVRRLKALLRPEAES